MDEETKPFLSWDVKHFQFHTMLGCGIRSSICCALWRVPVSVRRATQDLGNCLALSGLPDAPHFFISPGHAQSSFIAVGTFDINATNCPGTDYSCYVVVIIKLIIFLMLQICHSSMMCFFHVLLLHLILTCRSRLHSWHGKIAHLFLKSRVWEYLKKRKWKI